MNKFWLTNIEQAVIIAALKNHKIDLQATIAMNFSEETTKTANDNIEVCDNLIETLK